VCACVCAWVVYLLGVGWGGARRSQHAQQAHFVHGARAFAFAFALIFALLTNSPTHTHTHKHAQAPYSAHLTRSHSFSFARSLALALSLSLRSVGAVGSLSTLTLALPPAVFIISCLAVPCASSSQSQLAADDVSPLRQ